MFSILARTSRLNPTFFEKGLLVTRRSFLPYESLVILTGRRGLLTTVICFEKTGFWKGSLPSAIDFGCTAI